MMNSVLKSMGKSNMQFYENLHKKYFNKAKQNKEHEESDENDNEQKGKDLNFGHFRDNSKSQKSLGRHF